MKLLKKKDGFQGQKAIVIPMKILAKFSDLQPIINQLHITDIGYYPNAQFHFRQRPHGAKQHILIYCISGKGIVNVENQTFEISSGNFVLIPANTPHFYTADEKIPWTIYWMHFSGSTSSDLVNLMRQKMQTPVTNISFQENRIHLFQEIYSSLEKGYSLDNVCYSNLCLHYFLASCCFDNNYNYLSKKEKNDSIDECIIYMQNNLSKVITIHDIANAVNLSTSHIGALFKKKTGFSLIEYFNQLKTQKACQYLLFTDLRINEIALELGIEDPYYFTRMFTKIIGSSPAKYRASQKMH